MNIGLTANNKQLTVNLLGQTISLYRNAYGGLSKGSWLLALVMLINRSGTMVVPFLTVYLTQNLHFSVSQAGIIMGLFGFGAVLGAYLGGKLTDHFGYYYLQFYTLVLGGLFFIVLGYMRTFESIAIFIFLQSVVGEAFRPANAASIAFYSNAENRTRSYSLNRLAVNLGWAIGPALGGLLATFSYQLLFWVDGLTCIGAGVLFRYLLEPKIKLVHEKEVFENQGVNSAYRDKVYLFFVLFTILNAIGFFQFFSMLPVYMRKNLLLLEWQIGLVMAANGLLITLVEMLLVYKLEGKRHILTYICWGVATIGASFLLLNVFKSSILASVLILIFGLTLGEMLSMPFMNAFWIGRAIPQNRGQYAALYTMCYSIAHVVAPTMGSQVVQHFNFEVLWYVVAGICGVSLLGFAWLQRFQKNHELG